MYDDGFHNITSIDISNEVVKQMQDKYKEKYPSMKYLQMDCRQMAFEQGSFDAVIDKGTLDSILCGDSSGPNAEQMLNEIYRVLSSMGVYICITYGFPENRESYFKNSVFEWDLTIHKVAKPTISTATALTSTDDKEKKNYHFIYVLKKKGKSGMANIPPVLTSSEIKKEENQPTNP